MKRILLTLLATLTCCNATVLMQTQQISSIGGDPVFTVLSDGTKRTTFQSNQSSSDRFIFDSQGGTRSLESIDIDMGFSDNFYQINLSSSIDIDTAASFGSWYADMVFRDHNGNQIATITNWNYLNLTFTAGNINSQVFTSVSDAEFNSVTQNALLAAFEDQGFYIETTTRMDAYFREVGNSANLLDEITFTTTGGGSRIPWEFDTQITANYTMAASIPEPSAFILSAVGLIGCSIYRRR